MDRRVQQRSKYRGGGCERNPVTAGSSSGPAGRAHVDGNDQFKRSLNSLKIASDTSTAYGSYIEETSFTCDSRQSSSRKACGRPIKALIHEDMSRETKSRQPSPSVIARLMGLDALPPAEVLVKQQKDTRSYSRKATHAEDISLRISNTELEFKDVFEIKDSMKVEKHKSQSLCRETPCSKQDEADVAFVKQKFMEAKCLSTDEKLQNSKELNDALEVLNSNEDLVLQFLQEPSSLFTKHLHDLKCSSASPHQSHNTVLNSSKSKKREIVEASNSELKAERCTYPHKDVLSSCRKLTNGHISHSGKEHSGSLSHKFLDSQSASKTKSSSRPTWIVVLKPSLEKSENLARIVSPTRSNENHHSGFRRHKDFQQSALPKLHAEGRERQKLFDNLEVMGRKTKGSREIAQEITRQMQRSVSSSDKIPFSESDKYSKDDSLHVKSGRYSGSNFEAYQWTSNSIDCSTSCSSPFSSCTESSVSKEARRRLSERWRLTQLFQEARLVARGSSSSTLGEMLALSDRDASRETSTSQKVSDEKLARDLFGTEYYPLGISSRDGWKEECSKNIYKSSSLSSSTGQGTSHLSSKQRIGVNYRCYMLKDVRSLGADDSLLGKLNQRRRSRRSYKSRSYKSNSLKSCEEENELPVREIHVTKQEMRNWTNSTNHSEMKPIFSVVSLSTNSTSVNQVNSSSIESMDVQVPFVTDEGHARLGEQDGQYPDNIHTVTDEALEVTLADNPQVDSPRNQCDRTDPESHKSLEESEQPSPVSVLELPYEEHPSRESFERVNAGLQGLRRQLQLLRLEKSDTYDEECEALSSSEDDTGGCSSPQQEAEMLQTFRNEEERDFSYLLDILVDSGVHGAKQDEIFDACYTLENPVHPGVFEKLEKKYDTLGEWSRSARKLCFDLISCILAEVLAPFLSLHPWVMPKKWNHSAWGHERLLEEVWQMVVRQRKEVGTGNVEAKILDTRWLVLGDDVDIIGRQIECMLKDDLLDELVLDFIFG